MALAITNIYLEIFLSYWFDSRRIRSFLTRLKAKLYYGLTAIFSVN